MSYHIYTTDGIILKRTNFGEANVLIYVLTQELGLIIASARSARLSVSKLGSSLQEYSLVTVSCVKGKGGWKITNVSGKENFFFEMGHISRSVMAAVVSLVLQMIVGESPHPEIFNVIRDGLLYLKSVPDEDTSYVESLLVFRILYQLGYVGRSSETENFLTNQNLWNESLLQEMQIKKPIVIGAINKALQESQL